ncbi:hypothetical protein EHS25_005533 [Saitozyma podzolica]|uniref:SnoaL-like domain-containing protein n=1 Tax=Saitozyma podzolica TaxID=1890683 RepID=A0A427XXQ1_9TREE|nr:hypothetical protein EHS25_005533 [Saitozyma podzolica]
MPVDAETAFQVQQVTNKYSHGVDHGDFELVASCFDPEGGYIENVGLPEGSPNGGRRVGRDNIVKYVAGSFGACRGHCRHWIGLTVLEDLGDGKVRQKGYCTVYRAGVFPNVGPYLSGEFVDVLQKTATGEYVFLNRQFRVDPGPIGPADDVLITKFDAAAAKW